MSKKIIHLPVFSHLPVHGIVPGNKKTGVKIGLNQNVQVKQRRSKTGLHKKQAPEQMPQPDYNYRYGNNYTHNIFCLAQFKKFQLN